MEYTVIKDFIERGSLKDIKAGEKYTCLDPLRANKLIGWGYLKAPDEKQPESEDVEKPEKKTAKAKTTAKRSVKTKKA